MIGPNEQEHLVRLRAEMVAAREALNVSTHRITAAFSSDGNTYRVLSPHDLATHKQLVESEENATTSYVQCLFEIADQTREKAARLSCPAPL
jgi:hypothetical protein